MFCKVTYFNILSCYVLCCIVTQNTIRLKKGDKTTMNKKYNLFRSNGHTKKYKEEKINETRERKTYNKKKVYR